MKKLLLLIQFVFLTVSLSYGQFVSCEIKSVCENDLLQNEELVTFFQKNTNGNAQDSWHALFLAKETENRVKNAALVDVSSYLKSSSKSVDDLGKKIIDAGGYVKWKLANAGSDLLKRFDDLGLSSLITKLDDIGIASKRKFLDDFAEATDDALAAFNKRPELVDYWKGNNPKYKLSYTAPNDLVIDDVLKGIDNSIERNLIKEVQDINSPLKDGSFCVSGGVHSELSDIDNIIKYNLPKMDGVNNASKYNAYVDGLEIEIRNSVRYMDVIREDFKAGGKLYKTLLNVDESVVRKITGAGKSGVHAEVQVYNEIIKRLKSKGISLTDDVMSEIKIFVKNKHHRNMCRCPNCFYIIGDKVKMLGNE
ncbi:hypothetical protein [Tenacibaculum ovolyticum]|uniref:hypothetical protein n=1 Tax=Tenacibaculum ovolyticum TaxID=104270 RepID=UPI001F28B1BC|nr:hypothetical protein [Tenacibaculum ovolyticum]